MPERLDVEGHVNVVVQKLFPLWYAVHAAEECKLPSLQDINPRLYATDRWFNVRELCSTLCFTLSSSCHDWSELMELLKVLVAVRLSERPIQLTHIHGVDTLENSGIWSSLMELGLSGRFAGISNNTNEDLAHNFAECFPPGQKVFNVSYREWDGRYALTTPVKLNYLTAIINQCLTQRIVQELPAEIKIYSVDRRALGIIAKRYWLVVLHRAAAKIFHELFQTAKVKSEICDYPSPRYDLAVLVTRKQQQSTNKVMRNLLRGRVPSEALELGEYLSRVSFPYPY